MRLVGFAQLVAPRYGSFGAKGARWQAQLQIEPEFRAVHLEVPAADSELLGDPAAQIAEWYWDVTEACFGLAAGLTDDVERLVGRPPIDFRRFAEDQAAAWRRDGG